MSRKKSKLPKLPMEPAAAPPFLQSQRPPARRERPKRQIAAAPEKPLTPEQRRVRDILQMADNVGTLNPRQSEVLEDAVTRCACLHALIYQVLGVEPPASSPRAMFDMQAAALGLRYAGGDHDAVARVLGLRLPAPGHKACPACDRADDSIQHHPDCSLAESSPKK